MEPPWSKISGRFEGDAIETATAGFTRRAATISSASTTRRFWPPGFTVRAGRVRSCADRGPRVETAGAF
jgi:hypothetical protein